MGDIHLQEIAGFFQAVRAALGERIFVRPSYSGLLLLLEIAKDFLGKGYYLVLMRMDLSSMR